MTWSRSQASFPQDAVQKFWFGNGILRKIMSARKRKCTDLQRRSERRGLLSSKVDKLQCIPKVTKPKRRFCPHCGKHLAEKTYRRHRRLYYDDQSDCWKNITSENILGKSYCSLKVHFSVHLIGCRVSLNPSIFRNHQ